MRTTTSAVFLYFESNVFSLATSHPAQSYEPLCSHSLPVKACAHAHKAHVHRAKLRG